ncbi:MAG: FtsW/RodA/SpoVE family cell cycle protein [Actinomycetaceae bacterium]|nr:FtsW/RodA/SpoVE family cell cycle protein [Actinomycetaceae bacterium]MDY6083036.1 FtsW/RodA/SpoVE family cell cycle protein [Actinomycetaceae bacterium]
MDRSIDSQTINELRNALILVAVCVLILVAIGVTMVFSATAPASISREVSGRSSSLFGTASTHLLYAVAGIGLCWATTLVPLRIIRSLTPFLFAVAIVFQLLVLTPLGRTIAGNRAWVALGPVSVQPGEFVKLVGIIALAGTLSTCHRLLTLQATRQARHEDPLHAMHSSGQRSRRAGVSGRSGSSGGNSVASSTSRSSRFSGFIARHFTRDGFTRYLHPDEANELVHETFRALLMAGALLFVAALSRDMGSALVIFLIFCCIFWFAGYRLVYFGVAALGALLAATAGIVINPSRISRILSFFNSLFSTSATRTPTQRDFALWAFGSGGLSGTGLGTGVEKWPGNLTEAQNDFIFAVIGEELGFVGCLAVIVLFVMLGYGLLRIAIIHPLPFARLLAGGTAGWLVGQAMLNMMVVTGLLPVFGVPLPFISQGGSAILAALLSVGVVGSSVASMQGIKESLHIRPRLARRARSVFRHT